MTTGIFVSFDPHVAFTALLGACIKVCMCAKLLQSCLTLRPCGLWPARLLCPWDSPGKNTGVVAIPFSRGSSQPSDQTQVSHTAGRFFAV